MSLAAIVHAYIKNNRPKAKAELERFKDMPSLALALKYASQAIDSDEKRQKHQHRIPKSALVLAHEALAAIEEELVKAASFDDLLNQVELSVRPIRGIGELYIYDTTQRFGAYLGLYPQVVYLHSGTRAGVVAMGFSGRLKFVEVSAFPEEFRGLQPYEIEDVLCIYKDILKKEKWRYGGPD
jgi:hypothetical protein